MDQFLINGISGDTSKAVPNCVRRALPAAATAAEVSLSAVLNLLRNLFDYVADPGNIVDLSIFHGTYALLKHYGIDNLRCFSGVA